MQKIVTIKADEKKERPLELFKEYLESGWEVKMLHTSSPGVQLVYITVVLEKR